MDLPDAEPSAYALIAHCFTCSKDVVGAARMARALTAAGIAVLRFDFTGLGGSGGELADTDFNDDAFVAAVLAPWAVRYISRPVEPATDPVPEGSVVVSGTRPAATGTT